MLQTEASDASHSASASRLPHMLFARRQAALTLGRLLRDPGFCESASSWFPCAVPESLINQGFRFLSFGANPAPAASGSPPAPPRLLVLHPASLPEHSLHEALRLGESFTGELKMGGARGYCQRASLVACCWKHSEGSMGKARQGLPLTIQTHAGCGVSST